MEEEDKGSGLLYVDDDDANYSPPLLISERSAASIARRRPLHSRSSTAQRGMRMRDDFYCRGEGKALFAAIGQHQQCFSTPSVSSSSSFDQWSVTRGASSTPVSSCLASSSFSSSPPTTSTSSTINKNNNSNNGNVAVTDTGGPASVRARSSQKVKTWHMPVFTRICPVLPQSSSSDPLEFVHHKKSPVAKSAGGIESSLPSEQHPSGPHSKEIPQRGSRTTPRTTNVCVLMYNACTR